MALRIDRRGVATAAGLAVTAVLVSTSLLRVAADPFGESHDGRNGSIWSAQAQALRSDGIVDSRLGARFFGSTYANHPPLIVLETAAAEAIGGERRAASRAPAYLGSIAALILLWRIARHLGLPPVAAAWGLAVAASSHLFTAYLSMLDTPVTALPFGLLLVERAVAPAHAASGSGRRWVLALLAGICAVAGWQALLLGVLVGGALIATGRAPEGRAVLGGAGLGLALVIGWQLWVYGSLANLREQLSRRSGTEVLAEYGGGPVDALSTQLDWVLALTNPVALLGLGAGGWLLVRDGGARRWVALVAIGVVGGYVVALPGAAAFHDYWSFWIVAPGALGVARLVEWALDPSERREPLRALTAAAVVLAPVFALTSSEPADKQADGVDAARLAARASEPPARSVGAGDTQYWAWYEHDRGRPVPARCDEGASCIVLVHLGGLARSGYDVASIEPLDVEGSYALVTADELAAVAPPVPGDAG